MTEIIGEKDILVAVDKMASEILQSNFSNPIFLALLKGAVPFATDLMRSIQHKSGRSFFPDLHFMQTRTYNSNNQIGQTEIIFDTIGNSALKDNSIIIIDDVLDSGSTYIAVRDNLVSRGAVESSVKLAVFAEKDVERDINIQADFVAIKAPNKWLYGYGLNSIPGSEYPESGRWLMGLHVAD